MKILKFSQHLLIATAVLVSVCACNSNASETKADSKEIAEDHNEAKFDKPGEKDAQAVVDAYSASMFENAMSDSVNKYVTNNEVKTLSASVAQAHATIDEQLRALAAKKTISLPTALTAEQMDKVNDLHDEKVKNIDKNYLNDVIAGNKDAIDKYEQCAKDCTDPDIKAWFAATLPELRKQLDMAMACNDKMKM